MSRIFFLSLALGYLLAPSVRADDIHHAFDALGDFKLQSETELDLR